MATYGLAHLEDIEEIDDGRTVFRPVRHHFGITTFGILATTARADGDRLVNEHDEAEPNSSEELYIVISGEARFEIDGEVRSAPAGTFVHVPAGTKRAAVAETAGTTLLAIGAGPDGRPFQASGWELFAPLFPLFASGDYAEGADRACALLPEVPHSGAAFYNTACFESLAGREAAALGHLARAIELEASLAKLAREDEDFAPLRQLPGFIELTRE